MSKQNGNKGRRFDRAFKEEAVRLLQTSGRRQRQIAGDLGISVSALGRWVAELREEDLLSGPHEDAAKEITGSPLGVRYGMNEPPRVYRRVKLSKDEPYDTTQTYPVLYG